jgi:hypothetical protein
MKQMEIRFGIQSAVFSLTLFFHKVKIILCIKNNPINALKQRGNSIQRKIKDRINKKRSSYLMGRNQK